MNLNSSSAFLPGYPFPAPCHELLLKAALLDGDTAVHAFREWKLQVDFEGHMETSVYRTLPLLYLNLLNQQVEDDLMPKLKGIYRKSWMTNHMLFAKAGKILDFFAGNGIPTMILKGIPLTILVYKNHAVRPMADIDLLVPFSLAVPAIDLLRNNGWKLHEPEHLEHSLKYGRSATFSDSESTELDLHWHPVFEMHDSITDNDFWDSAVELSVAGRTTRCFCATDQLFHIIVHGLRYNPEPPVRWIADACTLMRAEKDQISWERLVSFTLRFRVHLQMLEALRYLAGNFRQSIPEKVTDELSKVHSSYSARVVFMHAMKIGDREPVSFTEKLYTIYAGFLRQTDREGFWHQHIAFVKYFRFRTKGKPYFKILAYYLSVFLQTKKNKQVK